MFHLRFMAPLLVAGVVWCGFLMGDDKKEPIVVSARLPTYYSRLGLSLKQKNAVLKIRGKYAAEIQELKQKISDLQDKEKADCETVLTSAQKTRLREIVGSSKRRRIVDDDNAPVNGDKKKDAAAKDKKAPVEIKK